MGILATHSLVRKIQTDIGFWKFGYILGVGGLGTGTDADADADAGIDADAGTQDMNTIMILYYLVTEQLYTQSG